MISIYKITLLCDVIIGEKYGIILQLTSAKTILIRIFFWLHNIKDIYQLSL